MLIGVPARDNRTPAQRCHDALKLGLETAIASGGLGVHRGHPVTVVAPRSAAMLEPLFITCGLGAAPAGGKRRLPGGWPPRERVLVCWLRSADRIPFPGPDKALVLWHAP